MKTLFRSTVSLGLLGLLVGAAPVAVRAQDNAALMAPMPAVSDTQVGAEAQQHAERAATLLGEISTALDEMKASGAQAQRQARTETRVSPDPPFTERLQPPPDQPERAEFAPPAPDADADTPDAAPIESPLFDSLDMNYGDTPRPDATGDYYPDLYMDNSSDQSLLDTSGPDYPISEYDYAPELYRDDYPNRHVPANAAPSDLAPIDRPEPETPEYVTPDERPLDTTDLDAPLMEPDDYNTPARMPDDAPESYLGTDLIPTDPLPLH